MSLRYKGGVISATPPTTSSATAIGVWTLTQQMQAKNAGNWPSALYPDTYFNYTTLLLPGTGTNGAQNNTFLDSSSNNFSITRNGNTTQGTFSPFSVASNAWSNYFNNSTGLTINYGTSNQTFWNNDFTLEFWINCPTETFGSILSSWADQTFGGGSWGLVVVDGIVGISNRQSSGSNQGNFLSSGTTRVDDGAWHHVVITQVTGANKTFRLFIDGILRGYQVETNWTQGTSASVIYVGYQGPSTYEPENRYLLGYLSNLRLVTNIVSTYSTSATTLGTTVFTPPTSGLTNITGTNFLICQSNRFVDNSSNAYSITRNGNVNVEAYSPFAPNAVYSTTTNGGSGYFDGVGDYLSISSTTAFDMSGDFTVEMWVYPNQLNQSNTATVFSCGDSSLFQFNTLAAGTKIEWYPTASPGTPIISVSYAGYLQLKQWNHLVVCRTGTTLSIFVNGTRLGTATDSTSYNLSQLYLSYQPASQHYLDGYMSDVRVIKGSGPYNATQSTLTIPTAPLTSITNTSLLCNFTNAGIADATAKNDLETVGNAQISTAQSKFGGSSIYFDGTGDYLTIAANPNFIFGTGNFTIEGWFYLSSLANNYYVLGGTWTTGTSEEWLVQIQNNGTIRFLTTLGTSFYSASITTGTWYHFAAVRNGSTVTLYINGSSVGSYTNANTLGSITKTVYWGIQNASSWPWNGYIDDIRITKGIARYTANFTPPASAFPLL